MANWKKIVENVRGHIEYLKDSLEQQGFTPPEWNAIDIANEAADKAKQQLESASSDINQSAYLVALKEAKHIMVRDLDWDSIRSEVVSYVRSLLPAQQRSLAEDIADETFVVAFNNWDSEREPDWAQPGLRFAKGVAWKLAKKAMAQGNFQLVGNPQALAGQVSTTQSLTHINGAELVKVINEWLAKQPPRKAAAFILDIVYGVDQITCGWIAYPKCAIRKTNDAYRSWWYRIQEKMHKSLRKYLDGNRRRYIL